METFDIAVAGAGPAGSMAAYSASRRGKKVCLLERKITPGVPYRCGEGIGKKGLILSVKPKQEWLKNGISSASMISPAGIRVDIGNVETSYILDREVMDNDLVELAINAGTDFRKNFPVISIERNEKGNYLLKSPSETIQASCVIIADGVESRLARNLGWKTTLETQDIETCAFARVYSPEIENSRCLFYMGKDIAPGGYAWIFPRAQGEANVGLGISGTYSRAGKPYKLLLHFIKKHIPNARIEGLHCGGVPVTKWLRPLVKDGAMLVGDAARQVNCLNGAGIAYSLYAGKLAGKTAAEAISGGTVNYSHLKQYQKQWKKRFGKQQDHSYSLKQFIQCMDDPFLDKIALSLANENPKNINYLRVFTKTFAKHPLLLLKVIKLFG